jgi:DnaJ-class molecular chaperone
MKTFHEWMIIEATSTYAVSREQAMGILGVREGFAKQDLETAYRRASLKAHPDRGGDPVEFKRVVAANEKYAKKKAR